MWLVLTACGGSLPAPPSPPPANTTDDVIANQPGFVVPGEEFAFRASVGGLTVGRVAVAVGHPGVIEDRRAITVRSHGASDGVLSWISDMTWQLTTTLDLETSKPLTSLEDVEILIAGEREEVHQDRLAGTDDVHSVVGIVRGWRSKAGERRELDLGVGEANLDVEIWEAVRERAPKTTTPAVRYDGIVEDRFTFSTWISDDIDRVPLRFRGQSRWGAIEVELESYAVPNG